jgi:hypothetical protein
MAKWQEDNAFDIAHGGDRPAENAWQKAFKQTELVPVTSAKKNGLNSYAKSHGVWKFARDTDSNAPALVMVKDSWEVVILGQNIQPFNDNDKTNVFGRIHLDTKMMTDKDIKDACEKKVGHKILDNIDVTKLKTFGTIEQSPLDSGLHVVVDNLGRVWTAQACSPTGNVDVVKFVGEVKLLPLPQTPNQLLLKCKSQRPMVTTPLKNQV